MDELIILVSACTFLAAKTCEEARRIRDVINAVYLATCEAPLGDSHRYWALKEATLHMEQRVLRVLAFDTRTPHTQRLLLDALRHVGASHQLSEVAVGLLNDSAANAACMAHPSSLIVAVVMGLAADMLERPLPPGWLRRLGSLGIFADEAALRAASGAFVHESAHRSNRVATTQMG